METLIKWQEKYEEAKNYYDSAINNIIDNDKAYRGVRKIKTPDGSDAQKQGSVSRKMCFELVETQADITLPMPRVISVIGREDRALAIENVLRSELDRLPMEKILDEQARLTPICGGSVFFVEWDNTVKTPYGVGKLKVKNLDPKQVIPQPGVYNLDEMDYVFVTFEQSKDYIKRTYGVDVELESDSNEEVYPDMRTHVYCYYRESNGHISLISWVGDTVIQNYKDYFARKIEKCENCGKDAHECECKNPKIKLVNKKAEKISYETQDGVKKEVDVDYYVPDCFPIVIRNNVSVLNEFLGSSDIDYIKDQQNDLNIYMNKIREKMLKGGSYMTLPEELKFEATDDELKIIRVKSPADVASIKIETVQPNVATDVEMLNLNYEIGRQTLGITDTFQGRRDTTATSGKAKEIAVQQTAGRLKSKQVMKDFAFSQLYELMFKFLLAFTDEQIPYIEENSDGTKEYKWFDKRLFLDEDSDGNLYYDDQFTFSVDIAGTLANDREGMWKETRNNFQAGAYGDPKALDTLEMYWTTMNKLHYPCAPDALELIKKRREEEMQMAQQQAMQDSVVKSQVQRLLAENLDQQRQLRDYQVKEPKEEENVDDLLASLGI